VTDPLPDGLLDDAAMSVHGHRCRHPFVAGCTGPSEVDRAYALAALSPVIVAAIRADERDRIRCLADQLGAVCPDPDAPGAVLQFAGMIGELPS
jgi:hypothetical protein